MSEELEYLGCSHEAARLLPWFVAGALAPEESARVQAHLQDCSICAADERRERKIYAVVSDEAPAGNDSAAQDGLQKLMARIDEYESGRDELPDDAQAAAAVGVTRPRYARWLIAAVVVQAVSLGVLGTLLWDRTGSRLHAPRFTTLTSPSHHPDGEQLRVVFEPAMTMAEVQAVLSAVPATVVAGPSESGVYTLAVSDRNKSIDAALGQLRANPKILFAEPQ